MMMQVSGVPETMESGQKLKVDRAAYLADLVQLCSSLENVGLLSETASWLGQVRDRAANRLQELAIPSTRDEEWRFLDLSDLLQIHFQASSWQPSDLTLQPADLESFALPEALNRLVFVDGVFAPQLSARISTIGLTMGNLLGVQHDEAIGGKIQHYLATQQGAEEVFTSLNTASFRDAAIVWVPRNQEVKAPIHLLFVSTSGATPTISHPRCLVVAESGSSLTLIEEYVTLNGGGYFTNPVTEIWLEDNAQVNHTRVQRDSATAFHIGKTAVSQGRDSRYSCTAISLGGQISRHHLEVYQTGEQTQTTLNGLTVIAAEQEADTHSTIAFAKPYGSARQVHKCIIDDRAHAVFNGKIFVPKPAQLTDAGQLSQTLLLSSRARVDTKPQLEITADNVKCAHGATVSQLEGDEVFYLQSRGIDQDSARKLLIYAFAHEVIQHIPAETLRQTLSSLVKPST
jgi:Fe-S cluster assembly protein SufD